MRYAIALLPIVALVAACGKGDAPTGQVVATVNGEEITLSELNAELGGARAQNPAQQKLLQASALQNIINRMVLAQAAEEQGVGDSPADIIAQRRSDQLAQIGLMEQRIRSQVPAVSREEAEQFVSENPVMFADRKIFLVEQITVPSPPAALIERLRPLNTMAEVQGELGRYNLPGRTSFGVIDAVTMNPDAVKQIAALPGDAVFILPETNAIRINRIRETQTQPITGADATNVAMEMLRERRVEQQVAEAVNRLMRAAQSNIVYNADYRPPATPPRAAAPANAPAAAPANSPASAPASGDATPK
ncbi:MAG: SurA N-terminal domain-containing protein [Sphingopyxis sp.]